MFNKTHIFPYCLHNIAHINKFAEEFNQDHNKDEN